MVSFTEFVVIIFVYSSAYANFLTSPSSKPPSLKLYRNVAVPYVVVYVGTPASPYLVGVDTGSSISWIPQAGCNSCRNNHKYDSKLSSSHKLVGCEVAHKYNGTCAGVTCGSKKSKTKPCQVTVDYPSYAGINGTLHDDNWRLGFDTFPVIFTGATSMQPPGRWKHQLHIDGILGLAQQPTENWWPTVLESLVAGGTLDNTSFGLAVGVVNNCDGQLTLGGYDTDFFEFPFHRIPMDITVDGQYTIKLQRLSFLGTDIGTTQLLASVGIVDSGTSLILLPGLIVKEIKKLVIEAKNTNISDYDNWKKLIADGDVITDHTFKPSPTWPNFTFELAQRYKIDITPADYIAKLDGEDGWSFVIQESNEIGYANATIVLGSFFMQTRYWYFDVDNKVLNVATRTQPTTIVPEQCPASNWVPLEPPLVLLGVVGSSAVGVMIMCGIAVFLFKRKQVLPEDEFLLAESDPNESMAIK